MTVLFSPLGLAYGTLYSAILLTRPDRLVVVTSPQAIPNLHATLDAARIFHTHFEWESHVLEDAHSGFRESRVLAQTLAINTTPDSHHIINLTGGSTALQDCVRSIADILWREGRDAREVAAIDRRDALEQRRAPFVVGELIEVPPL